MRAVGGPDDGALVGQKLWGTAEKIFDVANFTAFLIGPENSMSATGNFSYSLILATDIDAKDSRTMTPYQMHADGKVSSGCAQAVCGYDSWSGTKWSRGENTTGIKRIEGPRNQARHFGHLSRRPVRSRAPNKFLRKGKSSHVRYVHRYATNIYKNGRLCKRPRRGLSKSWLSAIEIYIIASRRGSLTAG
jgi:hypothetical protein